MLHTRPVRSVLRLRWTHSLQKEAEAEAEAAEADPEGTEDAATEEDACSWDSAG